MSSNQSPTQACTNGERYEALVPDTLDLADRMNLSINALSHVWYPDTQWCMGFIVEYCCRTPRRYIDRAIDGYLNIRPKFVEALVLCRLATGNQDGLDVDRQVIEALIDCTAEDGLTYYPSDVMTEFESEPTYTEVWAEGRMLIALSMLIQVDKNQSNRWCEVSRKKVDRLLALTREKDGFRFLWKGRFYPGEEPPDDADEPCNQPMPIPNGGFRDWHPEASLTYSVGALGHGAALLYRVTGYEPALELARGLVRWALKHVFHRTDGRYDHWHFHHGLYALMAICEYACTVDDRAILERVDACYRWAREMGDPLVGFYPEYMPGSDTHLDRRGNSMEICEVSDMVFLALYLTRAGVADYWDDIDRCVRNMYAEGQILNAQFHENIPEHLFQDEPSHKPHAVTDRVAEHSVGSFLGWMRANDGLTINQTEEGPKLMDQGVMHCCTANGSRTLYYVWDSIVNKDADEVKVNLLVNRASKWLDVDSYLPVQGKVVLHIKDAPRVTIRLPQWCDSSAVQVMVGGTGRTFLTAGQWVTIGWLKPGDEVTLTFPVPERTIPRVIGELPYKLTLRGSNVVDIEPRGIGYPLYQNQPTGKLVKKTRFIPKIRNIVW